MAESTHLPHTQLHGQISGNQALELDSLSSPSVADLEHYYGQAELPDLTDELSTDGRIPKFSGSYSYVFKGQYRGEMVAIKVLKEVSNKPNTMRRKLRREMDIWRGLDHANVVRLYGYTQPSIDFGEIGALISPWQPNGDAETFLRSNGSSWNLDKRKNLWHGTVAGVSYLHNNIPTIIHGDLKPSNVLIGDEGTPKLCDFGLARIYMEERHTELTTTSPHSGTERYLAPELLRHGAVPTAASDVYALGCIGLVFLFDQRPYAHHEVYRPGLITIDIKEGIPPATRPETLEAEESELWTLLELCWDAEPSNRPPATGICVATSPGLEIPGLIPEEPQDQGVHLGDLGNLLQSRFNRLGDIDDVEKAISYQKKAVILTPDWHPNKPKRFSDLGVALKTRFNRLGHMEDLEDSISYNEMAVNLTPDDHPGKPNLLDNLGSGLKARFDRLGHVEDLERAIAHRQKAVDLTPDDHPSKPNRLNNLGSAFGAHWDRLGHVWDLERSIAHKQKAVDLTPDGHPGKSIRLNNLGNAFQRRFDRLGRVKDLEMAIEHKQNAVDLIPDGHSDKPRYLNNLGDAYETRFNRLGGVEHLETAVVHKQKAVDLTPDAHLDKPGHLNSLGSAFKRRFNRLSRVGDLEMAIAFTMKAVDLTPDGHPSKPEYFNSFGNTMLVRFDRLGRMEDLEMAIASTMRAVELTPDDHPSRPKFLNGLGNMLETRFNRIGHFEDLEMAIAYKTTTVNLTPEDHPSKPEYLSSLGSTMQARFDWLSRTEDLETAIASTMKAVELTPDDHPNKPKYLNRLGGSMQARFGCFGSIHDLEIAISYKTKAVEITPHGHPSMPEFLNGLGSALQARFDRLGQVEDLNRAIASNAHAKNMMPENYPDTLGHLTNPGLVIQEQFRLLDRVHIDSLERSDSNTENAAELTPEVLNSLGGARGSRSSHLGHPENLKDLEKAITQKEKAVKLTPDNHPDKSGRLNSLGRSLVARFKMLMRPRDGYEAAIHFSLSAMLSTGSPRDRIKATISWARISDSLRRSPLPAYHIAIGLLPRIVWLGLPITGQHALLEEVKGIVLEAVSAAVRAKEYELAIEWAEAGRSLTWQNLLKLRAPFNELRTRYPELAGKLEIISQQLDISMRSDKYEAGRTTGLENPTRSHVQLALDWDNIVAEVRFKPGFESFLKPKCFNQLASVTREGPVVILNIGENGCDALVLAPDDHRGIHALSIPFSNFSYVKSKALLKELKGLLMSRKLRNGGDTRGPMRRRPEVHGDSLKRVLGALWLDVAKPIMEGLAYQPRSGDLPHIWWCVTGPLAFLPIHAAGFYDTDELGSKLSDYVVSSYTPTLSALLDDSSPSQEEFRLLAIAQANAPGAEQIPHTKVEVEKIQALSGNINVTTLTEEDATVENVWREIEKSNWVHLACHGQQNIKEPMKSGLLLHDGTLELRRLIEKPLPLADFAYLSACQTATGDEDLAEESVHLAAAVLFAGFKGVIATMWSFKDDVGPRVAEDVYREILKDGKPNRKAAAHALHKAVKRLSEDPEVDMLHWVPFIHIGL